MHEHKSEQNPSYFNLSNRKILTPLDHVSSSSSCFQKNYSVCGGGGRGGSGKGGGGKPLGMKKKTRRYLHLRTLDGCVRPQLV